MPYINARVSVGSKEELVVNSHLRMLVGQAERLKHNYGIHFNPAINQEGFNTLESKSIPEFLRQNPDLNVYVRSGTVHMSRK